MGWLPKNKVLVPIDFSDEADAALETALELVEDASHLHVIHVLPVLAASEPGLIWDQTADETRREQTESAIRERFADDRHKAIELTVTFGDPGSEIATCAEDIGAELIVLPSHGRTGLTRLLIGSVAERVCRLAHCPVLVLRQ